jgi:pimeloyl-ACP methyl ester carboxylesterase
VAGAAGDGRAAGLLGPADARDMTDALPEAELVTMPEAGHLSAVEQPAESTAALRGFLARW